MSDCPAPFILSVYFDRVDAVYAPGDFVEGSVKIDVFKQQHIKDLKLVIKGRYFINLNRQDGVFDTHRIYFDEKFYLLHSNADHQNITLACGQYEFRFQYRLPQGLPSSHEGMYGFVRYSVRVIMHQSCGAQSKEEKLFTVFSPQILSPHMLAKNLDNTSTRTFRSCTLCLPRGRAVVRCRLPKVAYYAGEVVTLTLNIDNQSTTVGVERISVQLIKKLIMKALHVRHKPSTETVVLQETGRLGPIPNQSEEIFQLLIPNTLPTRNSKDEKVLLEYELKVLLQFSSWHLPFEREFPLVVLSNDHILITPKARKAPQIVHQLDFNDDLPTGHEKNAKLRNPMIPD